MPKSKKRKKKGASPVAAISAKAGYRRKVLAEFTAWYRSDWAVGTIPDPQQLNDVAVGVFDEASRAGVDLMNPKAEALARYLGRVPGDERFAAADTFAIYLNYLVDTERWSGSENEYDACFEAIDDAQAVTPGIMSRLAEELEQLPPPDNAAIVAATGSVGIFTAITEFLNGLGTGRAITGTQGLRLADLTTVADALAIELEPSEPWMKRPASMWEVPLIAAWWRALEVAEIITLLKTRVKPGPRAASWLHGSEGERAELATMVIGVVVSATIAGPEPADGMIGMITEAIQEHASTVVMLTLGVACVPHLADEFGISDVAGFVQNAAAAVGGAINPIFVTGAISRAESSIMELAQTGLLEGDSDSTYRVPGALRGAVGIFVLMALRAMAEAVAAEGESPGSSSAHGEGTALTLKIAIADTKPAVWRRVVVAADMSLADLHGVICTVFAWHGGHLHQFSGDDWYGRDTKYATREMIDNVDMDGFEPADDVGIGEMLTEKGDKLFYVYDFGDDWRHVIHLEKIEADAVGPLPVCTGGRGAAPMEDSGGPWGWADKVAISTDPKHPEHAEIRDWLELEPGESIDPATFDRDKVNEALAGLR